MRQRVHVWSLFEKHYIGPMQLIMIFAIGDGRHLPLPHGVKWPSKKLWGGIGYIVGASTIYLIIFGDVIAMGFNHRGGGVGCQFLYTDATYMCIVLFSFQIYDWVVKPFTNDCAFIWLSVWLHQLLLYAIIYHLNRLLSNGFTIWMGKVSMTEGIYEWGVLFSNPQLHYC